MGVEFEVVDVAYPYVCAVYRCACGAVATRHGEDAASAPPHWLDERSQDSAEDVVVCPHCAQARAAGRPA